MATWDRVVGDANDSLVVELGGVSDLTSAISAEAHVRSVAGTGTVTLSATVTDATNRLVTVQLGTWLSSTATADTTYRLETQVTFAGGVVLTWPETGYDTINIRGQIA